MVARKKRYRYKVNAIRIAQEMGINLDPENWEEIWLLLDTYGEVDYLYAIVEPKLQIVKFGRSVNPSQRLKAIKTGNPGALKLWAYCKHDGDFTERVVHARLKEHRIYGEWFKLCDEAREVINGMRKVAGAHVYYGG